MASDKISVYNLADLKNTSDDALQNYLDSLHFVPSHRLVDVRLALGYGSLAVAAACFAWDYKLGFDQTKHYSAAAVVVYMVLSTALTLWQRRVEGATVYEAQAPAPSTTRISIRTMVDKHTPIYKAEVLVTPSDATKATTIHIRQPFAKWFDGAGTLVAAPFQSMLATAVPVIGKADPKRVAATQPSEAIAAAPSTYSAEVLEALAAAAVAEPEASASANGSASGKQKKVGGKRRKL